MSPAFFFCQQHNYPGARIYSYCRDIDAFIPRLKSWAFCCHDRKSQNTGDYERIASLFENGLIDKEEYNGLRRLNGLRNAIVHAYDSLILDEIYNNYESIISDIGKITRSFCEKY